MPSLSKEEGRVGASASMTAKRIYFRSRKDFRNWLGRNHGKSAGIWIEYYKDGTPSISYRESLEEALCHGWIDSIIKRIDDRIYVRKFTPRRGRSRWSETNRRLVAALIKKRLMTAAGLAKIGAAKKDGTWNRDQDREEWPDKIKLSRFNQLRGIIRAQDEKTMLELFDRKSEKARHLFARYYFGAKQEETKKKRLIRIFEVLRGIRQIL